MKTLTALLVAVLFVAIPVSAHQTHGWKHAEGTTGPAISGRYCSDLTRVWEIDKDGDGVVDAGGCLNLIFIHEKLHIKVIIMKDGVCKCPE